MASVSLVGRSFSSDIGQLSKEGASAPEASGLKGPVVLGIIVGPKGPTHNSRREQGDILVEIKHGTLSFHAIQQTQRVTVYG
jgi:hypothetical protein